MSETQEPHQRVRSGKLRPTSRQVNIPEYVSTFQKRVIHPGVENVSELPQNEDDDEYLTYLQTPMSLSDTQVRFLTEMAMGYGISESTAIDRDSRKTWNIGSWHIGDKLSISFNLIQPNIYGCWAILYKIDLAIVEEISIKYIQQNVENAKCVLKGISSGVYIQGRWTPVIIDELIDKGLINKKDVEITSVNIGQSSLFCWVILATGSKFLCHLTKESTDIIVRYIPPWCKDITETSSGGSTTLKIRNPNIVNDAAQISISDTGGLRYQGRPEHLRKLPEALSTAIHATINSIHLKLFLDSLEYKSIQ